MVKRRVIRALVVYCKTFYFLDRRTEQGLDPNVWFNNVEIVAARRIGRETVQYVSNIYRYTIAYKLITEAEEERAKTMGGVKAQ